MRGPFVTGIAAVRRYVSHPGIESRRDRKAATDAPRSTGRHAEAAAALLIVTVTSLTIVSPEVQVPNTE